MPKISTSMNAFSKLGLNLGTGINAAFTYSSYKDSREQGNSRLLSGAKAAGEFVLFDALGWWALPFTMLPELPSAAVSAYEGIGKMTREMDRQSKQIPFANSTFTDFNQAVTMRQAGMKMAQASKYNLQQAMLGNEATYLRR